MCCVLMTMMHRDLLLAERRIAAGLQAPQLAGKDSTGGGDGFFHRIGLKKL